MSAVAEIKAAIDQLSLEEQQEVKSYLRQRIAEVWNVKADSGGEPKQKQQATLGATSL
jgi:hypothetical protein